MKVSAGQVWKDNDPRGIARLVRVICVGNDSAVVENVKSGRRSIVALRRFRPTSTGYVLIESPQAQAAADPVAGDSTS